MYLQPKRIEFLDSVRGLAAMFVLLFHSMMFEWPAGFKYFFNLPVSNILLDGHAAVTMFFVLSGFVLGRPYLIPQSCRKIFLPTFYLRRVTRIWIPWFFVFCFSAVMVRYFFLDYETIPDYDRVEVRQSWHFSLTLSGALRQMALMNLPLPKDVPDLLPQNWTLGIELKASLLLPFFIYCARGTRVVSLAVIIILLMVVSPHGYYVSFVLGVALARGCDSITVKLSTVPRYVLWLIFSLGILLYQSLHIAMDMVRLPEPARGYFWCLSSLGCVLILAVILSHEGMQKILQRRSLLFLGRISYSIYLIHMLVLLCVQPLIVYSLNSMGITQTVILLPVSLGVNIFCTLVLATLTQRFVEEPSIEFGHWLTRKIQWHFTKIIPACVRK